MLFPSVFGDRDESNNFNELSIEEKENFKSNLEELYIYLAHFDNIIFPFVDLIILDPLKLSIHRKPYFVKFEAYVL